MATALDLEYVGCANGTPVAVRGEGRVERRNTGARLALRLEAERVPLHWDPALVFPGLCIAAVVDVEGEDSPVIVQGRGHLWDENGRDMGEWAEPAVVERVEGRLRWRAQLLRCDVRFEALERVRAIETLRLQAIPIGEEWSAVTIAWTCTTGHGNGYRGVTVAAIDRPVAEASLRARQLTLAREPTANGGEAVSLEALLAIGSRAARKR